MISYYRLLLRWWRYFCFWVSQVDNLVAFILLWWNLSVLCYDEMNSLYSMTVSKENLNIGCRITNSEIISPSLWYRCSWIEFDAFACLIANFLESSFVIGLLWAFDSLWMIINAVFWARTYPFFKMFLSIRV